MKFLVTTLFVLMFTMTQAQDFYDLNTIQTIEITFAESNWDQLLDNAYAADAGYIMAQNVTVNGVEFDSVGVKYKGNSTYNAQQTKNPFHIELDTYKDQEFEGYTDIKLSNVAKDPSFLREVLSYQILRQYMDAPLSNYANVYVNGNLIGLYSNSEAISKKFINKYFYSKKNTFIKCNPIEGAGPGATDLPDLVYKGQDSTAYYAAYELKSDAGWQELINLCDTLANHTDHIEKILDVNRTLWMHAFNNILVNLDSYAGGFTQNYYLYRDDSGRFLPVVWDLNESFGQFSMTGTIRLNNTTSKQQMTHLLHENDADFPLIQKLLAIPTYKRMYLAHCKTILLENFDSDSYAETAQELQALIDASVQADNNKFFTYNNFIANLNADVNAGGRSAYPGITTLMDGRNNYLLGVSDFTQTEPTITDVILSTTTPVINEAITITATISDANTAFVGYRSDVEDAFEQVEMFDDGAHNDGTANNGVFGAEIPVDGALTQYYLYAENDNIGMFSPRRAEHEFYNFTATTTNPTVGDLVINEFMASNDATAADQDGEFDDWIELYNNGNSAIDLSGYFLSDDADDLMKWEFPEGTSIDANSYLIIWADDDEAQDGLHTTFKLSAAAESVILVNPAGDVVDEVSYVEQTADISYGRFPNGTGNFQTMTPTFNGENSGVSSVSDSPSEAFVLKAFPNPAKDEITIEADVQLSIVSIYNLQGQKALEVNPNQQETNINISQLVAGMYFIKAVTKEEKVVTRKIIVEN